MKQYFCIIFMIIACLINSCGTILYPDRRDGRHTDKIDAGVAVLDATGLLFFIIPGLVAFTVDFATGCIYTDNKTSSQNSKSKK